MVSRVYGVLYDLVWYGVWYVCVWCGLWYVNEWYGVDSDSYVSNYIMRNALACKWLCMPVWYSMGMVCIGW